jgi:hypothetical protein
MAMAAGLADGRSRFMRFMGFMSFKSFMRDD